MTGPAAHRRAVLLLAATAAFVVLTTSAMAVYQGGSRFDLGAPHYQFFGNFFSDLGSRVTYTGRADTASRALFTTALTALGLAFSWSSPMWKVWDDRGRARGAATAAARLSIVAGVGFVGIALTSGEPARPAHVVTVEATFTLLLAFTAALVTMQVRNHAPRAWAAGNGTLLVVLAVYVALAARGPRVGTFAGLRLQIVTQKVVVYASILNLSIQAAGVIRRAGSNRATPVAARGALRPATSRAVHEPARVPTAP